MQQNAAILIAKSSQMTFPDALTSLLSSDLSLPWNDTLVGLKEDQRNILYKTVEVNAQVILNISHRPLRPPLNTYLEAIVSLSPRLSYIENLMGFFT